MTSRQATDETMVIERPRVDQTAVIFLHDAQTAIFQRPDFGEPGQMPGVPAGPAGVTGTDPVADGHNRNGRPADETVVMPRIPNLPAGRHDPARNVHGGH